MSRIEQTEQAANELSEAVGLSPQTPSIRVHYAEVLAQQGHIEKAIGELQSAIALDRTFADAYLLLSAYAPEADELGDMEVLFKRKGLSKRKRKSLAFALGSVCEAQRDFARAFSWFTKANELSRELAELPPSKLADIYDRIVRVFATCRTSADSEVGYEDAAPFVVAGTSRSGKSLVEKLLCCHDSVAPRGETGIFPKLVQEMRSAGDDLFEFLDTLHSLPSDSLHRLGKEYVEQLTTDDKNHRHLTDTHPGNTMFIGLLRQCLPDAKIIVCRRNAKDACITMYKNHYASQNHYSDDLGDLGDYWSSHERMLDLWKKLFPNSLHEVVFEDLVRAPEDEARKLIEFCGLSYDDACHARVDKLTNDASRWPAADKAIGVWEPYESYLAPLVRALEHSDQRGS